MSPAVRGQGSTERGLSRIAEAHDLLQIVGEVGHGEHVAWLAGRLFDASAALHGLGAAERELLICAGLLHDVGVSVSFEGHHKHSRDIILQADLPSFTDRQRRMMACLARYHRKAGPSPAHSAFADLRPADQRTVMKLAALLRVADGLDREHGHVVKRLRLVQTGEDEWTLYIESPWSLATALWAADRKRDVFEAVFGVRLRIVEQPDGRAVSQHRFP